MSVIPIINVTLCDGCGLCLDACHAHAVEMVEGNVESSALLSSLLCCRWEQAPWPF